MDITDHSMSYEEFDHYLPGRKSVENFFNEPHYSMCSIASIV